MSRFAIGFAAGCLASLFAVAAVLAAWYCARVTKVHRLESPLLLAGATVGNRQCVLPKGTVLYFDQAYPEGFSRFRVYINVDRMPLSLERLEVATQIDPLDARMPVRDEMDRIPSGCARDQ